MKSLVWLRSDSRMDDNPALEMHALLLMRFTAFIFSQKNKLKFITKPTARSNLLLVT